MVNRRNLVRVQTKHTVAELCSLDRARATWHSLRTGSLAGLRLLPEKKHVVVAEFDPNDGVGLVPAPELSGKAVGNPKDEKRRVDDPAVRVRVPPHNVDEKPVFECVQSQLNVSVNKSACKCVS